VDAARKIHAAQPATLPMRFGSVKRISPSFSPFVTSATKALQAVFASRYESPDMRKTEAA
jgi:hypothetical protein